MRISKGVVGSLLPCLLSLASVGPLAGQKSDVPANKGQDSLNQPAEFKGEAKVAVHSCKMQKGNTYRITVKGDGFVPQVWIHGQSSGTSANPTGVPAGNPTSLQNPGPAQSPSNVAQMLYTPLDTKVHQIKVDYAPNTEIQKGPNAYTLTIERAVFKHHVIVKDPQLEISEHSKKMEQGKFYSITVTGIGFAPELQILDGSRAVATAFNGRWFGFGPDAEFVTTLTFAPSRTIEYRILVAVGPVTEQRKAPLTYGTRIVELKLELFVNEQLSKQDPVDRRRGGPYKVHTVKLEAGKSYQIDMVSRDLDAYLFLEDSAAQVLAQDDDSGGGLNARLVFRPAKTDTYRIVATTFSRKRKGVSVLFKAKAKAKSKTTQFVLKSL
jgi:hypothetical protein